MIQCCMLHLVTLHRVTAYRNDRCKEFICSHKKVPLFIVLLQLQLLLWVRLEMKRMSKGYVFRTFSDGLVKKMTGLYDWGYVKQIFAAYRNQYCNWRWVMRTPALHAEVSRFISQFAHWLLFLVVLISCSTLGWSIAAPYVWHFLIDPFHLYIVQLINHG